MKRTTNNAPKAPAQKAAEKPVKTEKKTERMVVKCKGFTAGSAKALDPLVENAMRMNPHMKQMWITPHNANAPQYLLEGAKFYVNKYYNK